MKSELIQPNQQYPCIKRFENKVCEIVVYVLFYKACHGTVIYQKNSDYTIGQHRDFIEDNFKPTTDSIVLSN